jgi:hypothetical protein
VKLHTNGLTKRQITEVVDQAVSRAFVSESASRHRAPHHLGLSSLGGCTRAAAHRLARSDPSNDTPPGESRAANLGTWQHQGLLPRMSAEIDQARHEVEVTLNAAGLRIKGHIDLPAPGVVLDLKTVAEHRLQSVRRAGSVPSHVIQTASYAVALLQSGIPVRWLVLVYLDRASGDHETIVEEFTNRLALSVINRVADLRKHSAAPDEAPRVDAGGHRLYGPGFGFECNECPWLKHCWGLDAEPGRRQHRQYERSDIEALLAEYDEVRATETSARLRKSEILGLLEGVSPGDYGQLRYGRGRDTRVDDTTAAVRMLKDLGIPVPHTWRRGPVSVRLTRSRDKRRNPT